MTEALRLADGEHLLLTPRSGTGHLPRDFTGCSGPLADSLLTLEAGGEKRLPGLGSLRENGSS